MSHNGHKRLASSRGTNADHRKKKSKRVEHGQLALMSVGRRVTTLEARLADDFLD